MSKRRTPNIVCIVLFFCVCFLSGKAQNFHYNFPLTPIVNWKFDPFSQNVFEQLATTDEQKQLDTLLLPNGDHQLTDPKTGYLRIKGSVRNGLREGKWTYYLSNETRIGHYVHGKKQGKWKGYLPCFQDADAPYCYLANYKNDLLEGTVCIQGAYGNIHARMSFLHGQLHGPAKIWFPNPDRYYQGDYFGMYVNYVQGMKNGCEKMYRYAFYSYQTELDVYPDPAEHLLRKRFCIATVNYIHGKQEGAKTYYSPSGSGNVLATELYQNGKLNGEAVYQVENVFDGEGTNTVDIETQPCYRIHFRQDTIDGSYKQYYPNGQLQMELLFNNGKPYTLLQAYDSNGRLMDLGCLEQGTGCLKKYIDTSTYSQICLVNGERDCGMRPLIKSCCGSEIPALVNIYTLPFLNNMLTQQGSFFLNANFYQFLTLTCCKKMYLSQEKNSSYNIIGSDTVNRVDKQGKRQGKWVEQRPGDTVAITVKYFVDGMPSGTWTHRDGDNYYIAAWKSSHLAYCKCYTRSGKILEEGYLLNNEECGKWIRYDSAFQTVDAIEEYGIDGKCSKISCYNYYGKSGKTSYYFCGRNVTKRQYKKFNRILKQL